jgi:hypothetical protein
MAHQGRSLISSFPFSHKKAELTEWVFSGSSAILIVRSAAFRPLLTEGSALSSLLLTYLLSWCNAVVNAYLSGRYVIETIQGERQVTS